MPLSTSGRNFIAAAIINSGPPTFFDAANARLGVGNGTTAFAAGQTDLQGASKLRKLVSGAPGLATNVLTFMATFATGEANFAWEEIALFNDPSAGTMLCRVVQSLGTKVSGDWTLTHTVTVAAASNGRRDQRRP
jgi:hypothetical protein